MNQLTLIEEPAEEKKEAKEEKKEPVTVWDKKEWTILEKQAADPLPYPVPEMKKKSKPNPLVGTYDKVTDKSNPEFWEPMPIRATAKPLTSYVNGKPFKDGRKPKGIEKGNLPDPTVEIPADKAPHDWRDPEAKSVIDDVEKRSKMNAFEKRNKKKEEKVQKDYEEK